MMSEKIEDSWNRRQLLAIFGAITTTALAGCSGNGDEDSPGGEDDTGDSDPSGSNDETDATSTEPEDTSPDEQSTDRTSEDDDTDASTGGGSDGCPSMPLSYTSREWPDEDPYVSFEIPQEESVETKVVLTGRFQIRFGGDDTWTALIVRGPDEGGQGYSDRSVEERAENINGEPTDAYDVDSGVRVFTVPAGETETPDRTEVLLPSGSGSVGVTVTIGLRSDEILCQEAVAAAHRHLIETMSAV